jgi:hypothetical protein
MKNQSFYKISSLVLLLILLAGGITLMIVSPTLTMPDKIAKSYIPTPVRGMISTPLPLEPYVELKPVLLPNTSPPTAYSDVNVTVKVPARFKLRLPFDTIGHAIMASRWVVESYEFKVDPDTTQAVETISNFHFLVPQKNIWDGVEFIEVVINNGGVKRRTVVHHGTVDGRKNLLVKN